jgi:hypothetical protein
MWSDTWIVTVLEKANFAIIYLLVSKKSNGIKIFLRMAV